MIIDYPINTKFTKILILKQINRLPFLIIDWLVSGIAEQKRFWKINHLPVFIIDQNYFN